MLFNALENKNYCRPGSGKTTVLNLLLFKYYCWEYTYYGDVNEAERFEDHVTHHYEFLGDKLIIRKFCAIAKGIEFVMNGANHRMNSVTTYPFNIMGGGWEQFNHIIIYSLFRIVYRHIFTIKYINWKLWRVRCQSLLYLI